MLLLTLAALRVPPGVSVTTWNLWSSPYAAFTVVMCWYEGWFREPLSSATLPLSRRRTRFRFVPPEALAEKLTLIWGWSPAVSQLAEIEVATAPPEALLLLAAPPGEAGLAAGGT